MTGEGVEPLTLALSERYLDIARKAALAELDQLYAAVAEVRARAEEGNPYSAGSALNTVARASADAAGKVGYWLALNGVTEHIRQADDTRPVYLGDRIGIHPSFPADADLDDETAVVTDILRRPDPSRSIASEQRGIYRVRVDRPGDEPRFLTIDDSEIEGHRA